MDDLKRSLGQQRQFGSHPAGYHVAAVGDFAHDGTSDVLWYNPSTGDVDLWKIIDGHWAGSDTIGLHPGGWAPAGAGDFNHDGIADVLWGNAAGNRLETWLLGNVELMTRPLLVEGSKLGVNNAELFLGSHPLTIQLLPPDP